MNQIEYYSFDMFDTLITRLIDEPTDLFSIIEDKFNIQNFKKKRIKAEYNARKNSNYEEITIEDIYNELKIIDPSINTIELEKFEKKLEIDLCVINKNFINTYYNLKEKGNKIIIITDMYLDIDTIKKILSKNNISYDKLYLSSEIKKTKSTGSLYKHVLDDLNINSNQIIHYGDNESSDFNNAKKMKIKSILVNNDFKNNISIYNKKEKNYEYLAMEKFIDLNIENKFPDETSNYYYRAGYQTLGPLLYGYCIWLNENLNKNNIKKIFFLSRDGKIIKRAFDIIFQDFYTCYMFASRRGLIVPTLYLYEELTDPTYLKSIYHIGTLKIENLIKKVGLDDVNISNMLKKYEFNQNDIDLTDSNFKSFYSEIYPLIIENSKNEYDEMVKYLKEINFYGKVGIVDIGWFGNLQYALENVIKFSKINANVKGYYVGISPHSTKQDIQDMSGYLCQKDIENMWFVCLFEFFFSSTEGSFKRYANNGLEFYDYEYENSKVKNYLEKIQEGAIDFIYEFSKCELSRHININPTIAMLNFNKLGNSPSIEDVNYFKEILFYDDVFIPFISNSGNNYLFHPKSFLEDYRNSYWKTGFLNLNLHSDFDYSRLITVYSKFFKLIHGD